MMTSLASQDLDLAFHALSHATRRALLDRLADGEARVTDLASGFDLALNTVSKHVRTLEEARLVRRRVAGREHWVSADAERLTSVMGWAERQRTFWEVRLDALARLVEPKEERT
jgi:DNA-binding transcriptional ArsR family regulator